jgi:hypothetical protein
MSDTFTAIAMIKKPNGTVEERSVCTWDVYNKTAARNTIVSTVAEMLRYDMDGDILVKNGNGEIVRVIQIH